MNAMSWGIKDHSDSQLSNFRFCDVEKKARREIKVCSSNSKATSLYHFCFRLIVSTFFFRTKFFQIHVHFLQSVAANLLCSHGGNVRVVISLFE
ncbi:hypothetical protein Peur_045360 [Populus x canadensis]